MNWERSLGCEIRLCVCPSYSLLITLSGSLMRGKWSSCTRWPSSWELMQRFPGLGSAWKELEKHGSWFKGQATMLSSCGFFIGEVAHNREGVEGDGIICGPHAGFCLSLLLYSAVLKWHNLTYVAGGSGQVRFELNTFDGDEALWDDLMRHFWNHVINMGSVLEYWRLWQTSIGCYSSTNQRLLHHLETNGKQLIHRIWRAELDVGIGGLPDLWKWAEHR